MIPVAEALARIVAAVRVTSAESAPTESCDGRVLASDLVALRTQPPRDVSAMDGYAVRAHEAIAGATLTLAGRIAAGAATPTALPPHAAIRIFTGAPVPDGADSILIQENAVASEGAVRVAVSASRRRHIRTAGVDFAAGDVLLHAGRRLGPRDLALAAAMDHATIPVRRRPLVAILATGDELTPPGAARGPSQIVASSAFGLCAQIARWGGEPRSLGIAPDRIEALQDAARQARGADLLVTLGGASVGDHDLVAKALTQIGLTLDFWKIAMRPGKPLMFGTMDDLLVLGLPGNPVSALVCAELFLRPAIAAFLGTDAPERLITARLGAGLSANDARADYIRASVDFAQTPPLAAAAMVQDSSLLAQLAHADGYIVRPPHAPAAKPGDLVSVLLPD